MAPADPRDPYVDYTAERLFAYLPKARLEHPIGSTYGYSNLGAGLLGHALSRAAKTDYGTLVRERIGVPLGMTVTSLETAPALVPRVARGYDTEGPTPSAVPPWTWKPTSSLAGAGGLRSTAREMLRFLAANLGLTESKLSAAMRDAQQERADAGSSRMGVGLGWHLRKSEAGVVVWHNGGTGGFHSFCAFDPATKTGVVVLANGSAGIDDLGFHVLDPKAPLQDAPVQRAEVQVDPAMLAEYAGRYAFAPGVVLDCAVEAGRLACQLTGQSRFPVYAEAPSVFFYKVVDATLTFTRDEAGKVDAVVLKQAGVQQRAARVP
jgi:CubicO group peptidase (beta-lactamase class C family)